MNVRGQTRNFCIPEDPETLKADARTLKHLQLRHFQSKPPCNCHKIWFSIFLFQTKLIKHHKSSQELHLVPAVTSFLARHTQKEHTRDKYHRHYCQFISFIMKYNRHNNHTRLSFNFKNKRRERKIQTTRRSYLSLTEAADTTLLLSKI